jgi:hypothetical protein
MDKSDTGSDTGKIKITVCIRQLPRDKKTAENVSLCKTKNEQMQDFKRG